MRASTASHLAHEEGIAAGDAVQPGGVDGAVTDQPLNRLQAQRRQRKRPGARGAGHVAEQCTERMAEVVHGPERSRRPGLARQHRDTLNVVGQGERVEHPQILHPVAVAQVQTDVSGE